MLTTRSTTLAGMILLAAASRLVPHPPNFAPIAAMALFGGARFANKRTAFLVPLGAMFISDLFIGLHGLMPVVYGSFALIVCMGLRLRRREGVHAVAGTALAGSVLFFVATNFGVWALGSMYPKTAQGLVACYVAAIPFFGNTIAGDLFYAAALFGSFALAEKRFPILREIPALSPLLAAPGRPLKF